MTVVDNVRAFNKRLLNPLMLRLAGHKYWYASVVEHIGRRSGKHYATPVTAERVLDGFIIPLPYGVGVDWLRNVLASGHASIRAHGHTYRVTQPEIISADVAAPQLRPLRRHTYALFRIQNFLHVKAESS